MTPLKAIKKFCLDCYGGDKKEVVTCPPECELWELRFGKKIPNISPLKRIRLKCIWCINGSYKDIENCLSPQCAIYIYRTGHNPARKGIGGPGFKKMP